MSDLVRLSITMERDLHEQLQAIIEDEPFENRSAFLRNIIRNVLVQREWERDEDVIGTITLVFNHHSTDLNRRLTEHQHHHHDMILATTHVHLDREVCAEVIIARGQASEIQRFTEHIRQQRGVLHVALSMSTTGNLHDQQHHNGEGKDASA
ncbi:nickel-responsive transcriptional regulator NikR [bacterium]|nr:nickel-responsive transcriptional regulator NikR [bacterium]